MNNEKDELKECIAREFDEIAKEEEESLEKDTSLVVPEGTKEAVLARLKEHDWSLKISVNPYSILQPILAK